MRGLCGIGSFSFVFRGVLIYYYFNDNYDLMVIVSIKIKDSWYGIVYIFFISLGKGELKFWFKKGLNCLVWNRKYDVFKV